MRQFTNIRKVSPKMIFAGILTIIAMSAVAAPANAATYFYGTGYPGFMAYERIAAQCSALGAGVDHQRMDTDSPVVAPSPFYGLPQTIERWTRIESSGDNGLTWKIDVYLATQSFTLTTSGNNVVFPTQSVDLPMGRSYRIVEGFYFKFGNSYVGSRWYRLDQSDYSIIVSLWGHHDPTPTQFAAGCTIPSL